MQTASRQSRLDFFTKHFPIPSYLTLSPVALHLSVDTVRILTLEDTKQGKIPHIFKEVGFKNDCKFLTDSSDVKECNELKAVLIALKKEFKIKYANVSLPEAKTYIFKTTIPRAALDNITEAISFKLEENVPLPPQDVMFDYTILNKDRGHDNVDVVVSALPKNVIQAYSTLFKEVGITPVAFEPESRALARAVIASYDHHPYLILYLGESRIGVAIVEHNAVNYTTSFPISSKEITGDFNGPAANGFKEHLNKLLIYWFTNNHDPEDREKIQNVVLTGSYAMSPGLAAFLESKLKINVQVANVWKNCFDINKNVPPIPQKDSLRYAIAVGLALNI